VSVASIGNNRANAISENEPNYEPDCESDCEVRHHITLTPDREDWFPVAGLRRQSVPEQSADSAKSAGDRTADEESPVRIRSPRDSAMFTVKMSFSAAC
jgi:hypothetical protein